MPVLNIAAYRFVPLDSRYPLRETLIDQATRRALKGTILLAPEGINIFLAGPEAAVEDWLDWLQADARFAGLDVKKSFSRSMPFKRLRVRLKNEIITLRMPEIRPVAKRAPTIAPAVLRRWLARGQDDAGQELVILDTRNAFEIEQGRFLGARDLGLTKFSEFPVAITPKLAALQDKTVVTYCTGGIRCEKAALWLNAAGLNAVYQLDGGSLGYFAAEGGEYWEGACTVFDHRGALYPDLHALHDPCQA
jgi:UPF0176 protein